MRQGDSPPDQAREVYQVKAMEASWVVAIQGEADKLHQLEHIGALQPPNTNIRHSESAPSPFLI
jgi:hypothetical protein